MCRLIASLSKKQRIIKELIEDPDNSLITQTKPRKGHEQESINGDGFGIGWYDHAIETPPSVFYSTRPAWNDTNLHQICRKLRSTCFIAHVRAATHGHVNMSNCHPFTDGNLLFAHNGNIRGFNQIKRPLIALLDDPAFFAINGQTDSEHIFALANSHFRQHPEQNGTALFKSLQKTIQTIDALQKKHNNDKRFRLNTVMTDGKSLVASRHNSNGKESEALSLHYATHTDHVLVASEILSTEDEHWKPVPLNHILVVEADFSVSVKPI